MNVFSISLWNQCEYNYVVFVSIHCAWICMSVNSLVWVEKVKMRREVVMSGWKEQIRQMQSCWNFFNSWPLLVVNVILSYDCYYSNMSKCSKFWNCCLIWHTFLLITYYSYPDIDECAEETAGCNHNCTNNIGSFVCSCYIGYHLLEDMRTCVG